MKMINLAETSALTCLGERTILSYCKLGTHDFPGAVRVGTRSVRFVEEEIIDWLEARIAASRLGDGQVLAVP